MLSHELRSPIAPIRDAATIMALPNVAPTTVQHAQRIIARQTTQLALLLDDLLDIARITQGKLHLKMQSVALLDVVDAAVEAIRPHLDAKKHLLSIHVPSEQVLLDADPLRLSQILSNVLMNAVQYTDPNGRIALTGAVNGGTLSLSVSDTGIGIAPESMSGIFAMFSQIEDKPRTSSAGLGIGLALVKHLVELHGGTVEARSGGLGQGSEFIIRLPIASPHQSSPPSALASTRLAPPRRRILIADDNRDAADSLAVLLELAGHDVRVAHSGRSALSLAHTFCPDAAILDIGMPDMNGYDVAHSLRREPWGMRIQLIALTGWGQDADRERAMEAGFDHHVIKPTHPDRLLDLIVNRAAGPA